MSVRMIYSVVVSDEIVGYATVFSGSYKSAMKVYNAFESYFDNLFSEPVCTDDKVLPISRPVVTLSLKPYKFPKGGPFDV